MKNFVKSERILLVVCLMIICCFSNGCRKSDNENTRAEPDFSGSPFNGLWSSSADAFGEIFYYITDIGTKNNGVVAEKRGRFEKIQAIRMNYIGRKGDTIMFRFKVGGAENKLMFELKDGLLELTEESGFGGSIKPHMLSRVPGDKARSLINQIEKVL